ncbi:MAG: hypothetical protein IJF29_05875 [Firmicutes bacterium]|nr:hypothetical protein [Bacillota bacterium]
MTGFGYIILVSGLEIEDVTCLFGVEEDDIEAWCKGYKEIPDDKIAVVTEKCMVAPDLLRKHMEPLDVYEESRLFTAGVRIGALMKNLFSESETIDTSFGKDKVSVY